MKAKKECEECKKLKKTIRKLRAELKEYKYAYDYYKPLRYE